MPSFMCLHVYGYLLLCQWTSPWRQCLCVLNSWRVDSSETGDYEDQDSSKAYTFPTLAVDNKPSIKGTQPHAPTSVLFAMAFASSDDDDDDGPTWC
jgi:hypothetical protein